MTTRLHLHLICGPYHLALDGARVSAVRPAPGPAAFDLRQALELAPAQPGTHLLLGGLEVAVDRVAGMVHAADHEFAPLPAGMRRADNLIDAVLLRPVDGHHLLRLNLPQDPP